MQGGSSSASNAPLVTKLHSKDIYFYYEKNTYKKSALACE